MSTSYTAAARRLGVVSALATVLLTLIYLVVLGLGFRSLSSPSDQIGDPFFWLLELLILLLMPFLVALMTAVHAWSPAGARVYSLMSVLFMLMMAGVTSAVHFVILAVGREPALTDLPWFPLIFSFEWPSVFYALDILAWDVFFALSVLCAAAVFRGTRLARSIRAVLTISGLLALAGLGGVIAGDMRLRNVGIVGYAIVFPIAALLMALLFHRTDSGDTSVEGDT